MEWVEGASVVKPGFFRHYPGLTVSDIEKLKNELPWSFLDTGIGLAKRRETTVHRDLATVLGVCAAVIGVAPRSLLMCVKEIEHDIFETEKTLRNKWDIDIDELAREVSPKRLHEPNHRR